MLMKLSTIGEYISSLLLNEKPPHCSWNFVANQVVGNFVQQKPSKQIGNLH